MPLQRHSSLLACVRLGHICARGSVGLPVQPQKDFLIRSPMLRLFNSMTTGGVTCRNIIHNGWLSLQDDLWVQIPCTRNCCSAWFDSVCSTCASTVSRSTASLHDLGASIRVWPHQGSKPARPRQARCPSRSQIPCMCPGLSDSDPCNNCDHRMHEGMMSSR